MRRKGVHVRASWSQRAVTRAVAALVGLLMVFAVSACGSSGSSDSSTTGGSGTAAGESSFVKESKAAVETARAPLTEFSPPSTPPGPVPPGKSVVAVTCQNAAPLCMRAATGTVAAAQAVGWTAKVIDGGGAPQGWSKAVATGLTGGADAIVMNSAQPGLIPAQIKQAQSKGVPVVSTLTCEEPVPPGVFQEIESDRFQTGFLLGQWVVQDSPKGAEVLLLNSPEFPCLKKSTAGFKAALAKAGPSFKIVEEADSPISDSGTPAGPQRFAAMMRKNPNAKYFWVMSEVWAGALTQAKQAVNRPDVTGLGVDGDYFAPQIKQGSKFVMAGPDTLDYGYYVVDSLTRAFNHKPPAKYDIPFRLIDSTNAATLPGDAIAADFDLKSKWLEFFKGSGT
jgi:ABC-type sugar transport system substrate-binding protein